MTREQIDMVFEWCGWRREEWADGWHWIDKEGHPVIRGDGDPSKNPSDCHTVMQEVVKRPDVLEVGCKTRFLHKPESNILAWIITETPNYGESKDSECEAKMNAVLAMIEGRA